MSPGIALIEDPDTAALSWAHAICVELLVGPCATSELAEITGRDYRKLSAHTCHLIKRGLVEVYGEFLSETNQRDRIERCAAYSPGSPQQLVLRPSVAGAA